MYPYHNTIKKRIKNGELLGFHFTDNHPTIGKCLLLEFSTAPFVRPVRPHKYHLYAETLYLWKKGYFRTADKKHEK
ncbi:MAG: hypothetical protein IJC86_05420 [Clostridia bacterium]|nr:hypothetical protein [Clostridia bacterium]